MARGSNSNQISSAQLTPRGATDPRSLTPDHEAAIARWRREIEELEASAASERASLHQIDIALLIAQGDKDLEAVKAARSARDNGEASLQEIEQALARLRGSLRSLEDLVSSQGSPPAG